MDSINRWIARYNRQGIEGLKNKQSITLVHNKDKSKLFDKIIKLQRDKKENRIHLKDINKILKEDFDIHYKCYSA